MTDNLLYDVAVVGGGPAGMMAAGRAAELGAKVILIEKNPKLGKKLLITGGGRCNLTNAEMDVRKMVKKYGPKGKALFGSFTRFGVKETLDFFNSHGLKTKVEAEQRAFPASNKAEDVWKVLVDYLKKGKVTILYDSAMVGITINKSPYDKTDKAPNHSRFLRHPDRPSASEGAEGSLDSAALARDDRIVNIKLKKGTISAKNYIIATGGKSRPETGSTGEGLNFLKNIGHSVEEPDAALVPVKIQEQWVKDMSGLSFSDVKITSFQDGKKQDSKIGKILFTHFGLSGPLVLNMSQAIAELHKYSPVRLHLDLYPNFDIATLDKKVLTILDKYKNKKIKNSLGEIVPPKIISTILNQTGIDPEKEVNALTKEERLKIVKFIKNLPMSVSGFLGKEKAIVTSGGVSLREIDFKTMRSKLFSNLYLAGDILNFDRPSGGFSLQICWTTGYLAGQNSAGQDS